MSGFPYEYNYKTIVVPIDGNAPQPVIPIVDGFQCRHCQFNSQNRKAMKEHGNKQHAMKRVEDDALFQAVRLQTWFRDGKERYWVVDESKQAAQASQLGMCFTAIFTGIILTHTAARDVGEESSESEEEPDQASHSGDDDADPFGPIKDEIEQWKEEAKERRLTLLARPTADELDPWIRYTGWNEVLGQSKHGIVKTHAFARKPDPDEPRLVRLLEAWGRILNRCLDTLAATDHKDTLKWWASPKNEAASQFPFELHQNTQSVNKCSADWQQFICYAMRTAPDEQDGETGECK